MKWPRTCIYIVVSCTIKYLATKSPSLSNIVESLIFPKNCSPLFALVVWCNEFVTYVWDQSWTLCIWNTLRCSNESPWWYGKTTWSNEIYSKAREAMPTNKTIHGWDQVNLKYFPYFSKLIIIFCQYI